MHDHFLLVASDSQTLNGATLSGYRVALRRLKLGKWSIYRRTPNRSRLKVGARVLIYAAGAKAGGGTFVASATIAGITDPPRSSGRPGADIPSDVPSDIPVAVLEFSDIKLFAEPPEIQSLRDELSFIPKHNKWGAVLQGGCKNIDQADYDTIVRRANLSNEQAH